MWPNTVCHVSIVCHHVSKFARKMRRIPNVRIKPKAVIFFAKKKVRDKIKNRIKYFSFINPFLNSFPDNVITSPN